MSSHTLSPCLSWIFLVRSFESLLIRGPLMLLLVFLKGLHLVFEVGKFCIFKGVWDGDGGISKH